MRRYKVHNKQWYVDFVGGFFRHLNNEKYWEGREIKDNRSKVVDATFFREFSLSHTLKPIKMDDLEDDIGLKITKLLRKMFHGEEQYQKFLLEQKDRSGLKSDSASSQAGKFSSIISRN